MFCFPRLSVGRGRGVLVRRAPRDRPAPSISGSRRYCAQVLAVAPVGSEPVCRPPIRGFKSFTLERFGDKPLGFGCRGGLHVNLPVIRNIGGDDHGKLLYGFLLSTIELRDWAYATAIGFVFYAHFGLIARPLIAHSRPASMHYQIGWEVVLYRSWNCFVSTVDGKFRGLNTLPLTNRLVSSTDFVHSTEIVY